MTQYDDSNRGALFKNDRKESDKHPDYKGQINVAGHDYWLSAWIKKSKDGKNYMSLSIQQKDGKPAPVAASSRSAPPRTVGEQLRRDMDDEVPF